MASALLQTLQAESAQRDDKRDSWMMPNQWGILGGPCRLEARAYLSGWSILLILASTVLVRFVLRVETTLGDRPG